MNTTTASLPASALIHGGSYNLDRLREDLDEVVKKLLNREIDNCSFTGIAALCQDTVPEGFVDAWGAKGTWAINTALSQPVSQYVAQTKDGISQVEILRAQHFVQKTFFDALFKTMEHFQSPTVDILDSLFIDRVTQPSTGMDGIRPFDIRVTITIKSYIVARKMWHLSFNGKPSSDERDHHYSFGEAMAALLVGSGFDGIVFKYEPDNDEADISLTRADIADILRQHQARAHQEIIRSGAGQYIFDNDNGKKSPPFSEALINILGSLREPNTLQIARWLTQCKKDMVRGDDVSDIQGKINSMSSESRSIERDLGAVTHHQV
jgi:hypothetical protein